MCNVPSITNWAGKISSPGCVEHTFAKSVHKCAQYAHRVLNNVPCAYCAHQFLASTHFVHTFNSPENTLCVLLQGPEILCAYFCRALTHFVHTLDTLCSYLWVPSAPLSTLFPSGAHFMHTACQLFLTFTHSVHTSMLLCRPGTPAPRVRASPPADRVSLWSQVQTV